jgi:hypothetical protein
VPATALEPAAAGILLPCLARNGSRPKVGAAAAAEENESDTMAVRGGVVVSGASSNIPRSGMTQPFRYRMWAFPIGAGMRVTKLSRRTACARPIVLDHDTQPFAERVPGDD